MSIESRNVYNNFFSKLSTLSNFGIGRQDNKGWNRVSAWAFNWIASFRYSNGLGLEHALALPPSTAKLMLLFSEIRFAFIRSLMFSGHKCRARLARFYPRESPYTFLILSLHKQGFQILLACVCLEWIGYLFIVLPSVDTV